MIYDNKDKYFLVLVIFMFAMFYSFFLQKAENNRFKKASSQKFFNIFYFFLLKVRSVRLVDQQINFVLP